MEDPGRGREAGDVEGGWRRTGLRRMGRGWTWWREGGWCGNVNDRSLWHTQ
jgi:hypothetical protein